MTPVYCELGRVLLDLTQEGLAEISGVPRSTIGHFERGGVKSHEGTYQAIFEAFKRKDVRFLPNGVVLLNRELFPSLDLSAAGVRGWYMCVMGHDEDENPFEPGSAHHRDWLTGFHQARTKIGQRYPAE